jgi:hypothetical protein
MFVMFGPMPGIPVTFHGQTVFDSLDHQVDSLASNLVLGMNAVVPTEQLKRDVDLEPALIGFWLFPQPPA